MDGYLRRFPKMVETYQSVEVYPAQQLQPVPDNSAQDAQVRFVAGVAVTSNPELKATVA